MSRQIQLPRGRPHTVRRRNSSDDRPYENGTSPCRRNGEPFLTLRQSILPALAQLASAGVGFMCSASCQNHWRISRANVQTRPVGREGLHHGFSPSTLMAFAATTSALEEIAEHRVRPRGLKISGDASPRARSRRGSLQARAELESTGEIRQLDRTED